MVRAGLELPISTTEPPHTVLQKEALIYQKYYKIDYLPDMNFPDVVIAGLASIAGDRHTIPD
jgi:hypothetical protein